VIGFTLVMLASLGQQSSAAVLDIEELLGTPAPEWTATIWINSEPLSLKQLRGQVVLIRWWTGPECPFCEASAPYLRQWYQRYASQGLEVIGMYHPKPPGRIPPEVVKKLAQSMGMTFPLAIDSDWNTLRRYWLDGRKRAWTSVSFLIDQKGIIRYVHPGGTYSSEEAQEIETAIQELLGVDRPMTKAGEPRFTG